ncbi:unnamed protein product [Schistosoma mattheei]|uniref:Uncharacterized protein n=1 Tax=Schistosoma mattheei TaxID=31246 RepID=A0A183PP26_9TREM|nr:unnamed protein product [Schistosoma mattheei]
MAVITDKILARTGNRGNYIVVSTSRSNVDINAYHLPAQGDRGGRARTRLNFRDRCDIPEPYVPQARSRPHIAVSTRLTKASFMLRQKAA